MKKLFLIILFFVLALMPGAVFAHAVPVIYQPTESSVVGEFPSEVEIEFTERIDPNASSIIVYSPDGSRADSGSSAVAADPHFFSVPIRQAGEGTYAVSWQVVSADDGHFTRGAFVFSFGKETQIPGTTGSDTQVEIVHSSASTEGLTISIEIFGMALMLSALVVFNFLIRPRAEYFKNSPEAKIILEKRLKILLIGGALAGMIGVTAYLLLTSSNLAAAQNTSFAEAFVSFFKTVAGSYAFYRGLIAAAFLGIFLFSFRKIADSEKMTVAERLLILLVVLDMLLRSRVSHAAASHFYPIFSVLVNFVHLIFKNLWMGGLVAFGTMAIPLMAKVNKHRFTAGLFLSFSKMITLVIGVAGVTGAYIVWLHLKNPDNIFTSDWGSRFIFLTLTAGFILLFRLYHFFITDRKISAGADPNEVSKLKYTFPIETGLGILIILFTSFLIITTPPLNRIEFERRIVSQGVVATVTEHESVHFLISFREAVGGGVVEASKVVVSITNVDKNIGPIVLEGENTGPGDFVIPEKSFSPPGLWRVDITAQRTNGYDVTGSFDLRYPEEAKPIIVEARSFGFFEILSILGAIMLAIFSVGLYMYVRRLENNLQDKGDYNLALPQKKHWLAVLLFVAILALIYIYNDLTAVPDHNTHG